MCACCLQSGLVPGISPGDGHGPGCFTHTKGVTITRWQLWWWEAIMTFTLVSCFLILDW